MVVFICDGAFHPIDFFCNSAFKRLTCWPLSRCQSFWWSNVLVVWSCGCRSLAVPGDHSCHGNSICRAIPTTSVFHRSTSAERLRHSVIIVINLDWYCGELTVFRCVTHITGGSRATGMIGTDDVVQQWSRVMAGWIALFNRYSRHSEIAQILLLFEFGLFWNMA